MSSQAQIDANRINAEKSTGPTSDEGKAKSRVNAFKHGIYSVNPDLSGEDPGRYERRKLEYFEQFKPVGQEETYHVEVMIAAKNEQDRCTVLEAAAWDHMLEKTPENSINPLGEAIYKDLSGPCVTEKLARRVNTAHNRWLRSNKILKELQTHRRMVETAKAQKVAAESKAEPKPAPAPQPAAATPTPKPVPVPPAAQTQPNAQAKPQRGVLTGNEPGAWRL